MIDTADLTTRKTLQTYSDYKDSGVDWLGEIPAHWEVKRVKHICSINQFSLPENSKIDFNFKYVDIGSVTLEEGITKTEEFTFKNAPSRARRIARKNDTIISTVRTYLKAIDFIDENKSEYIYSTGFAVLSPLKQIVPKFLAMAVRSDSFTDQVSVYSKGMSYPAINSSELAGLQIALPPLAEQTRIAEFLDRKTAQIDQAIAQKERLIELLNERRQVMIHQAVTRGLNPEAPMKDSGIDWIGEIPAHWEVMRIKHGMALLRDGTHLPPPRIEDGYRLLSVRNIIDDKFSFREDDSRISEPDFKKLNRSFQVKKGDILLAIVGATLGKVAIVPDLEPFQIQRSLALFRCSKIIINHYCELWMRSSLFQRLLWNSTEFSAQPGIYLGALKDFPIIVPPLKEQEEIINSLKESASLIYDAVEKEKVKIQKLQELKSTLINSAVTGKIKV